MVVALLPVTDLELSAAQIVKGILLVLLLFSAIYNISIIARSPFRANIIKRGIFTFLLLILIIPVVVGLVVDHHLLNSAKYTTGTTLGMCYAAMRGQGVIFEY